VYDEWGFSWLWVRGKGLEIITSYLLPLTSDPDTWTRGRIGTKNNTKTAFCNPFGAELRNWVVR
jgi:hypothetical protein